MGNLTKSLIVGLLLLSNLLMGCGEWEKGKCGYGPAKCEHPGKKDHGKWVEKQRYTRDNRPDNSSLVFTRDNNRSDNSSLVLSQEGIRSFFLDLNQDFNNFRDIFSPLPIDYPDEDFSISSEKFIHQVQENVNSLSIKSKELQQEKVKRDEEDSKRLETLRNKSREEAKERLELTKEQEEHDQKFKNGKIFISDQRISNVGEIKSFLDFIKENIERVGGRTKLDGQCKEDISKILNEIKDEIQGIKEEIGGIEKCLSMSEKSPKIFYKEEEKDLKLAKQLVKDLESYQEDLCNVLAPRRQELNSRELEDAYQAVEQRQVISQVLSFLENIQRGMALTEYEKQQGITLLQQVEKLKKEVKASYRAGNRHLFLDGDTDMGSVVFKLLQEKNKQYQNNLQILRQLRKQLKTACKLTKEELTVCKVKVKQQEEGYQTDSSDEENFYSDQELAFKRGLIKGIESQIVPGKLLFDLLNTPMSETADNLLIAQRWLDEHPSARMILDNLIRGAGVAMWVNKITPGGLLMIGVGVGVNMVYEQGLNLFDDDIAEAQKKFSAHLQSIDSNLNKEQADILASTTIKFMKEVGRMGLQLGTSKLTNAAIKKGGGNKPKQIDKAPAANESVEVPIGKEAIRGKKVVGKGKIVGSKRIVNKQFIYHEETFIREQAIQVEELVDKAKIKGGNPLVNLEQFKLQKFKEVIGETNIWGRKGMVGKEFVYNINNIKKVKEDVNANMLALLTEITRQAKEAGATSVRINGNDIINDELRVFFRKAIREKGGKMRGFKVEGSTVDVYGYHVIYGDYVTLTKDL